jgi:hypothetical protein
LEARADGLVTQKVRFRLYFLDGRGGATTFAQVVDSEHARDDDVLEDRKVRQTIGSVCPQAHFLWGRRKNRDKVCVCHDGNPKQDPKDGVPSSDRAAGARERALA